MVYFIFLFLFLFLKSPYFFPFVFLMGRQERGSRLCYNRSEQRKSHLLEAVVTGDQVKPQNSSWQAELALTQPSLVSKKSLHLDIAR